MRRYNVNGRSRNNSRGPLPDGWDEGDGGGGGGDGPRGVSLDAGGSRGAGWLHNGDPVNGALRGTGRGLQSSTSQLNLSRF